MRRGVGMDNLMRMGILFVLIGLTCAFISIAFDEWWLIIALMASMMVVVTGATLMNLSIVAKMERLHLKRNDAREREE